KLVTGVQTCALPISDVACTRDFDRGVEAPRDPQATRKVSPGAEWEHRQLHARTELRLQEPVDDLVDGAVAADDDELRCAVSRGQIGRASCRERAWKT